VDAGGPHRTTAAKADPPFLFPGRFAAPELIMLVLADWACFLFHTLLIGFNMVGWAWRKTRLLHLVTLGLTAFSWFVLGAVYGWGYCLCSDWHFQVRERLGHNDPETSYIQLLARHVAGVSLSREASDWLAGTVFALIVLVTAATWLGSWLRGRKQAVHA